MNEALTLFLFLLFTFGLGNLAGGYRFRLSRESFFLRLGVGLGALPVLGVILNAMGVPLDWRVFLAISSVGILLCVKDIVHSRPWRLPELEWRDVALITVLLMAAIPYLLGPFTYPWLEDDDSWGHAAGIQYIAKEKNLNVPSGFFHYINPYPPGYDLWMGVLRQPHPSLVWTLKFFNGLIIALGLCFFYFFAKEFLRDKSRAIWATFFLSMIPCYLSHFIWAHALTVTLFFPALTCLLKLRNDGRYVLPAAVTIAGIFLTQPTQSLKFIILGGLLTVTFILIYRKFPWRVLFAFLGAGMLAAVWWGPVLRGILFDQSRLAVRMAGEISGHAVSTAKNIPGLFHPAGGTATRAYSLQDFIFVPEFNMINNPTGIGMVLCLLALGGGGLALMRLWRPAEPQKKLVAGTLISWLVFTFLGVNSLTFHLPVGLFAFRFWMLLAIPVCLLAADAAVPFLSFFSRSLLRKAAFLLLIMGVILTSGVYKWRVNLGPWPWGVYWVSYDELKGYLWLRENLKPGTKIFAYTDNLLVIGHDMHADYWSDAYRRAFHEAHHLSEEELHQRLKTQGFEYLILGQRDVKRFGLDGINKRIHALQDSGLFELVAGVKNAVRIFRIL